MECIFFKIEKWLALVLPPESWVLVWNQYNEIHLDIASVRESRDPYRIDNALWLREDCSQAREKWSFKQDAFDYGSKIRLKIFFCRPIIPLSVFLNNLTRCLMHKVRYLMWLMNNCLLVQVNICSIFLTETLLFKLKKLNSAWCLIKAFENCWQINGWYLCYLFIEFYFVPCLVPSL